MLNNVICKKININNFTFFDAFTIKTTILIWLLLNFSGIQNLYFENSKIFTIILFKLLHFGFLYFIINLIRRVYINRKTKTVKHGIIISSIYFTVTFIILLMVWPGTWSWDDVFMLHNMKWYHITAWQHFLTNVFQILYLQTLPFPTGIAIMQIFLASMIVGYSISTVAEVISTNKKDLILADFILFIPMVLPPILEYIFCGFRMGMYSYLELLLFVKLFMLKKENKKLSTKDFLSLSFLIVIIASWRTEAIYYPVCLLVLFLLLDRKIISYKFIFGLLLSSVILILLIGKINNNLIGNSNYSITATINPAVELIKNANIESDRESLEYLNRVLDIDIIYNNSHVNGERLYWYYGLLRDGYSEEDYKAYLKGYFKLLLKYPRTAFNAMWDMFMQSCGMTVKDNHTLQRTTNLNTDGGSLLLFNKDKEPGAIWMSDNHLLGMPIDNNLRNKVIRMISCINDKGETTFFYYIFWNAIIPIISMLICLIYMIFLKKWYIVCLILTILGRIPLIFITACAPYIMYYLSVYLLAYFITAIVIIQIILKLKKHYKYLQERV